MYGKEKQSRHNDELLTCRFKINLTSLWNRLVNKETI